MPPNATVKKSAMTRPRMTGSIDSCTVLFAIVVKVCADTPMMTRASPKNPELGMIAASAQPSPNVHHFHHESVNFLEFVFCAAGDYPAEIEHNNEPVAHLADTANV